MMTVAERNNEARYYVRGRLNFIKNKVSGDFPEFSPASKIHRLLTDLIEVKSKGFRGLVVTAVTGLYLNKKYDPLNNFYECNPRAIFENGIWYALDENGIPCGKSDPLNVAKNVNQLNEDWAQGRRPQSAAMAVVEFLRLVMEADNDRRNLLIEYFFFRLWTYSQSIANYKLTGLTATGESRQTKGSKLVRFSLEFPESGTIPQYLFSQLLIALYSDSESVRVVGGDESVFGTNTTSKKPADVWLEVDGSISNLYEVTVKPVSLKRLDDSIDSLVSTSHIDYPVTFVCRMDSDVKDLNLIDGCINYKGKHFDFVDYRAFCLTIFALLSDGDCERVFRGMADFVEGINISMVTKAGWNSIFKG